MCPARASSQTLACVTVGEPGWRLHWEVVWQSQDRRDQHGALSSYPPKLFYHGSKRPTVSSAQWLKTVGSPITFFPSTPETNLLTGAITSPSVMNRGSPHPFRQDLVSPSR